ncbi:DUF2231 domain-containing protein [Geminicoccus flavidas]|uniref:DUF2231 domain-containing protein n=1 Tax=Geminicoccus flavidas TaxID=2506407 RepID=UPI00135BA03B|nr:DUF2231 domain-containing protein [Geminicoccus flavidas]
MREHRLAAAADRTIAQVEGAAALDHVGYRIGNAVALPQRLTGRHAQSIRNALHGNWLGHPLHPLLVTIPIGAWTVSLALDLLGALRRSNGTRFDQAADLNLQAGCLTAVGAALAGMIDWQHTHGRDRRVGLVHALVNTASLGLFATSVRRRRQGRRQEGRLTSALAWLLTLTGAYLGGHLVYRGRIGVDHADRGSEPRHFLPVFPLADLEEDRPRRVEVWDEHARAAVGVVLVLHRGQVHALGARCAHMGGPLDKGWVLEGGLVCPWHGSRFCLSSGHPLDGPATAPQPRYEVRLRAGMVEIRRLPQPGDETVTVPVQQEADTGRRGEKADQFLFRHHELLRYTFTQILATPRHDPERRLLMRVLAGELEMHEQIEDEIFYPAVQPVSEKVPIAHAEHHQLADMLAVVVGLDTSSTVFDEHLQALYQAVDHHARSEETSMFVEAQRLGEERLRELGALLERRLLELRASRLQRARRALKIRALEPV